MAEAKISIKVGAVEFTGGGDSKFLDEQLDKVISKLPELARVAPSNNNNGQGAAGNGGGAAAERAGGTLASFLKSKNAATGNQTKKFLATAVWLTDTQQKSRLTTSEVSKALKDNNQGKLNNPSQCLAENVKQGNCERDGKKQFFVTDDGDKNLAHDHCVCCTVLNPGGLTCPTHLGVPKHRSKLS